MSRKNPVNPGTYTQAGRLTPDDAARERVKQRQLIGHGPDRSQPKAHTEAWMHQASRSRETAEAVSEPAHTSAAVFLLAAGAAICLSLYMVRRLAARPASSSVPATNHTPGRPYTYGI